MGMIEEALKLTQKADALRASMKISAACLSNMPEGEEKTKLIRELDEKWKAAEEALVREAQALTEKAMEDIAFCAMAEHVAQTTKPSERN